MKTIFILILACSVWVPASAGTTDIDAVRANFLDYYTASGADRTAPRMQQALGDLESATRTYTAPGYLLSDGSWIDVDYTETPSGSWSPWDHVRRLTVMAKAYRTPGQAFYRDPQLLVEIESSLRYVNNFYGPTRFPTGNWWFWTLGIPLDLGPTLVMMRGDVTQATYDDLVRDMTLRIGSSPAARGIVGPVPVGENLVWSSFTHLCLGLLKDDPTMLAQVRDAMAGVALPSIADGIQSDRSFHQHGAQLYTGGYGGSFANDVSRYAMITRGTAFALPQDSLGAFSDYIADGVAWSLYGNYFDVSVISREVARRSTTGFNGIAALVQSAQFDSPRAAEIRAAASRMLQSWTWGLPTELAGAATMVERSNVVASWPAGHRHYYESDYTVHRRPDWFASIKMSSIRTKTGENTNGENVLGSRQSDGRFFLSMNGTEYFGSDVWPALDWTRLPGITVEQSPSAADATYGFGLRTIAGGTGDGRNGVSMMDVAPLNSTLTAKKSWFFFDDAIVFLTSSITDGSPNRVETIVNQWPTSAPLTTGSNWMQADNVGYYFPAGNPSTKRETGTGTWAQLGAESDTTPYSATFLTLWFDHGMSPVNTAAEYAIVPNVSATEMRNWAASNPISIRADNATVAAVRNNRDNALGIAFFTAGSVDGFQADAPAVVYVTPSGNNLQVSAADPTNGATGTIHLTIPFGSRSVTIEFPRNGGRTFTTTVKAPQSKRRAVR
ncbi:MAG TPA: polysaccharide lyase family 8 super-sandwich domain-containing protein [Thermoanaerobaculia bacterium]